MKVLDPSGPKEIADLHRNTRLLIQYALAQDDWFRSWSLPIVLADVAKTWVDSWIEDQDADLTRIIKISFNSENNDLFDEHDRLAGQYGGDWIGGFNPGGSTKGPSYVKYMVSHEKVEEVMSAFEKLPHVIGVEVE